MMVFKYALQLQEKHTLQKIMDLHKGNCRTVFFNDNLATSLFWHMFYSYEKKDVQFYVCKIVLNELYIVSKNLS